VWGLLTEAHAYLFIYLYISNLFAHSLPFIQCNGVFYLLIFKSKGQLCGKLFRICQKPCIARQTSEPNWWRSSRGPKDLARTLATSKSPSVVLGKLVGCHISNLVDRMYN